MQKGLNSDIQLSGTHYHVQTEDWGFDNPFLVSRVFKNGAVIKSVKTRYSEVLSLSSLQKVENIRLALREQHQAILDLLVTGQID